MSLTKLITSETALPIGLVITIATTFLGGVVFVTSINYRSIENKESLIEVRDRVLELEKQNLVNAERTARIETKIDSLTATIDVLSRQLRDLELVQ